MPETRASESQNGKTLYLVRHAMALPQATEGDKMRALAPKGEEDARALGNAMKDYGYKPDLTLCSPAVRTRQTLDCITESVPHSKIEYIDSLYDGSTGEYLYRLQQIDDAYNTVLLVGHNPSIYDLVRLLAAQGKDSVPQRLLEGYQPATLSVIHCACSKWAEIQPAENELASILSPLDYNAPARPTRWM